MQQSGRLKFVLFVPKHNEDGSMRLGRDAAVSAEGMQPDCMSGLPLNQGFGGVLC